MKKILILGANPETVSLVLKAKEMGIKTYVTDYNPTAYAKKYADVACNIDATNVEELVNLVKSENIDGVLLGVAEALMPTYYTLCKNLNLPCFATLKQFEIMSSKDKFKNICRQYNVPVVPEFNLENIKYIKFPVIVKPVDSCSSKGIAICNDRITLNDAIINAKKFSKKKKVLIEKYINGKEIIVYYVIQNGNPFLVAMCDRFTNKPENGTVQLPTAYIYPSKYLREYYNKVDEKVRNMLRQLNIKNGVLFLQGFFTENNQFYFYEPGFRLNGAQEHLILANLTKIDAKELLIKFALNGEMSFDDLSKYADPLLNGNLACKLSPIFRCGKIGKIVGLEEIKKVDGLISLNPSYHDGDEIEGAGTLKQIVCRFFVKGKNKTELKDRIDKINNLFDVIDENGSSMLVSKFDTNILLKEY